MLDVIKSEIEKMFGSSNILPLADFVEEVYISLPPKLKKEKTVSYIITREALSSPIITDPGVTGVEEVSGFAVVSEENDVDRGNLLLFDIGNPKRISIVPTHDFDFYTGDQVGVINVKDKNYIFFLAWVLTLEPVVRYLWESPLDYVTKLLTVPVPADIKPTSTLNSMLYGIMESESRISANSEDMISRLENMKKNLIAEVKSVPV